MEAVRSRRVAEISPERPRRLLSPREEPDGKTKKPMSRRVQVVYYLARNGHLEHPHFMEVVTPANQPLRLRDVMKRLTVLRGKGMPSLYSWSCKRSYRNGYVWNDLAEDDVIFPSDNTEYVLKGSELVEGCSDAEKFQELKVSINRPSSGLVQDAPKGHLLRSEQQQQNRATRDVRHRTASFDDRELYAGEEEEGEEEEYEMDEEAKTSYTSSTTPQSRCSRGVSTEELEFPDQGQRQQQRNVDNKSSAKPVRSDSSELTCYDSSVEIRRSCGSNIPKRFEDGDPVESGSGQWGRGSVLLQLIACGNVAVAKAKNASNLSSKQKDREDLRKGVLCKSIAVNKDVGEEDREMIRIMSENPRSEEKEYFSGSIVEAVSQERVTAEPVLRKSNSFNEERIKNTRGNEEADEEDKREDSRNVKGTCIPRRRSLRSISSSEEVKK